MTFGAVFPRVMRPAFGPGLAASAAASWWLAGGATGAVAVYQPKGAASLAASYVNLANPGTYDAAPGVAPTWDATNGWTFNGSTQYLATGTLQATSTSWSAAFRFSNVTIPLVGDRSFFGAYTNTTTAFLLQHLGGSSTLTHYANTRRDHSTQAATSGVYFIAGQALYVNGADTSQNSTAGTAPAREIYIGALNLIGSVSQHASVTFQAIAFYNTTLTAPQVAAVSSAMAAL